MKESTKPVNELIDTITQTHEFEPIDNPNSTGLSPDLSDEDITDLIERRKLMQRPIDLCNADLTKATFNDVMFFSLAEGGAMGEPGAILFYVKSGELYHLNYVFGDVDINKVEKLFPTLSECRFGMFGLNSSVPRGWNYVNLGMGNHLIVNDDVFGVFKEQIDFGAFKEQIDIDAEPSEIYTKWLRVADNILQKIK